MDVLLHPSTIFLFFRESRRANGNLRANKPDDLLANLVMPNGMISPLFPSDLKGLFSLDGKSTECVSPLGYPRTACSLQKYKSGYSQDFNDKLRIA